jgi:hypothetical protein
MTNALAPFRNAGMLVLLLLWSLGGQALAQSEDGTPVSLGIQDAPLGQALEQAAAASGISLVYDADLVVDRRASCITQDAAPEALLRCLLDEHPIDFVRTSKGTYVLQASVRRPPKRGRLAGVVRGAGEGRPLPSAHVRLPNAKKVTGTAADSTGRFQLTGLLPGPYTVVVTHLGYSRHEATVYVPPNGTAHHEVTLAPSPIVATDSFVVDGARYGPSSVQSEVDRVSEGDPRWERVAALPDVLDAANSLLGVTASPPYTDLRIQGSSTGGHTLRLDGVPVRNPASAGRLLGAFSPLALDGLTARKAGFGALHGNALSGALDLDHDLSGQNAQYGTMRVDPRSLDARLQGTTTLGSTPVTAMVAGRVSVWDIYQDVGLNDLIDRWSTLDPVLAAAQIPADTSLIGSLGARTQPDAGFYDLHGAARFEFGPSKQLHVSAYHGGSDLGADLVLGQSVAQAPNTVEDQEAVVDTSDFTVPTRDEYAWTNTAAQARYEAPVGDRTMGSLRASVSHYRSATQSEIGTVQSTPQSGDGSALAAARQAAYAQEGANEVTEVDLESRFDVSFSESGGLVWTMGLTYQGSRFRIGNAFAPRLRHQTGTVRLHTAAETTVGLGAHTQLEGGLRLTSLPGRSAVYAEPRGALRYHRSIDGLGTVGLSVRGGLYRRFTAQFDLSRDGATAVVPTTQIWLPISTSLAPPRTYHLAADLSWQPAPPWTVDLEGYRKWQPHLLAVDYPALRAQPATSEGGAEPADILASSRGTAYGGGLRIEYDGDALLGSARYAYSRARRTFPGRFDGRLTPVPWTEPHRLTLNAEVPVGGGVALEAQGEGVWGRRWGFRRAYYAYLDPSDLGDAWERLRLDRPGTHVLPPRYQFDLGVSVTHSLVGVDVKGRLGVANVLNRENVADWALQPQTDGSVSRWTRSLPGRRATISVRIRY